MNKEEQGRPAMTDTKLKLQYFRFECRYKFGLVEAIDEPDAKRILKGRAWCENRCDTCKLKITKK